MAKTFFLDSRLGRRSNSGLYPGEPKHPDEYHALPVDPGDTIAWRAGQTHVGAFDHTRSGAEGKPIEIKTYQLGGEGTRTAWLSNPDNSLKQPIALNINASYVNIRNLGVKDTRYAGFMIRERQGHVNGYNLKGRGCGIGVRMRGSYCTLDHADFQDGVIAKNDGVYTEGAVAFSLEADGYLNTNNTLYRPFVMNAWDLTVAGEDGKPGQDGGGVEIFGDVYNFHINGGIFIADKGGVEIGGPTPNPTIKKPVALTRDGVIEDCLFINCGPTILFNDPQSEFPIRVSGLIIRRNTVFNQARKLDAVHFKGEWGDVSKAITFENNVYYGLGAWVGSSGKTTRLKSIPHSGNVYYRTEGAELGYTPGVDEFVGDPHFANPARYDFRLTKDSPRPKGTPGAMSMYQALPYADIEVLEWLGKKTRIPPTANHFKGGLHSHAYHRDMWATPTERRAKGMFSYIENYDQMWQLNADGDAWSQVDLTR